ncbi:MAG TPA: SDR family oxidoreductase [Solirubrobacteraceae bacterium]|nr:SDR family oxidoreductase [Solirubrobacteraceae bacterium]
MSQSGMNPAGPIDRLRGGVAVVTGAGGAFGQAISRRLAAEGAAVALWEVREESLGRLHDELARTGATVHAATVDVGDPDSVAAAAAQTTAALGPPQLLVNNAGISEAARPWEVTDADWDRHMRVNASGPFYCVRALLGPMRERRYGKIVNIGSLSAQQGRPTTTPAYPASKGAVLGLTVSLARHLAEFGITVNAINPGFIRTVIHDQFTPEQLAPLTADIPLARRGEPGAGGLPEDIAGAVFFLLSPDSDFITGEFLSVNGGSRTGS